MLASDDACRARHAGDTLARVCLLRPIIWRSASARSSLSSACRSRCCHGAKRLFSNLGSASLSRFTWKNLIWCLAGAFIGTAIGVLPGVGPFATMALLLPVTYYLPPKGALIMLAGIYYGAQYGGSRPRSSSTCRREQLGRHVSRRLPDGASGPAGAALAIAALGSFFAGCVATLAIAVAAPPLVTVAQQFARRLFLADGAGLMRDRDGARVGAQGAGMVFLGMLLGLVGTDVNTGNKRYTFEISDLFDGIGFVPSRWACRHRRDSSPTDQPGAARIFVSGK